MESMRTMKGCLQVQLDGAKDVGFETTYKKGGEKEVHQVAHFAGTLYTHYCIHTKALSLSLYPLLHCTAEGFRLKPFILPER